MDKKQVEWKREILVRFWNDEGNIPNDHLEALEEAGFLKAQEMIAEGYVSGDLLENINIVDGSTSNTLFNTEPSGDKIFKCRICGALTRNCDDPCASCSAIQDCESVDGVEYSGWWELSTS